MAALTMHSDRAGFPMIWIDSIGAYLHWLPVTKIQFEQFMCDAADRAFDAKWYQSLLSLNPRVTPSKVIAGNYWQALLSGILPAEAQRFAFWCGDGYRLPTLDEWRRAFSTLSTWRAQDPPAHGAWAGLAPRAQQLLERIDSAAAAAAELLAYERTVADQMLMRLGVFEWVTFEEQWGAVGEPFPAFWGNLAIPQGEGPLLPHHPESQRLPCLGFRLLFDPRATTWRN